MKRACDAVKGFSLLELVISIAVIVIIAALTLPNFRTFREKRSLQVEAAFVAGVLREVQTNVLSGYTYPNTNGIHGYGVRLSLLQPKQLVIFDDINGDGVYSGNVEAVVSAMQTIHGPVFIDVFSPAGSVLDVLFRGDKAEMYINGARISGDVSNIILRHEETRNTTTLQLNIISGQISRVL